MYFEVPGILLQELEYLLRTYIARPPSLAGGRSPAAGLVGCTQQYQNVTPAVRHPVLHAASVMYDDGYGVTHNLP